MADIPALEAVLNDANADVRQLALWALGQLDLERAPARAVSLLNDSDRDVREMSAWLLGQIQDRATIPALREAFFKEHHNDVARLEFRALVFMGDRSQATLDHAMASDDVELRARAVRMIGGQGPGAWPWPWPWPWPRPSP
jgi:HEAT repeat protein